MPILDKGFKSWAERCAINIRRNLGLEPSASLSATALAKHLDVELLIPQDVKDLPLDVLKQLLQIDSDGWSAVTFCIGKRHVVIYNPRHSIGRRSSDLMHELAHVVLGHEPSKMILSYDGTIAMRSFNQKQEDEAEWLSGCLLVPREALLYIRKEGIPISIVSSQYQISKALLNYRLGVTGVNLQIDRRLVLRGFSIGTKT